MLTEDGVACLHVRLDDWIVPAAEREPTCSAEVRHRLAAIPDVVQALRAGRTVTAPGYDAATRGVGEPASYNPAGQAVIVLEGSFAGHRSVRSMLDFVVFVAVSVEQQRARFASFYRWKGFDDCAIELLWIGRCADEWPAVDTQCEAADVVLTSGARVS
jgi:hypothetical protein